MGPAVGARNLQESPASILFRTGISTVHVVLSLCRVPIQWPCIKFLCTMISSFGVTIFFWYYFQTDGECPNTLVVAQCEVVKPRTAAAEHISQVRL